MRTRRRLDPQFKREAVKLSCSPNMIQRRVCEELGISRRTCCPAGVGSIWVTPILVLRWYSSLSTRPREYCLILCVSSRQCRFRGKSVFVFSQLLDVQARAADRIAKPRAPPTTRYRDPSREYILSSRPSNPWE